MTIAHAGATMAGMEVHVNIRLHAQTAFAMAMEMRWAMFTWTIADATALADGEEQHAQRRSLVRHA